MTDHIWRSRAAQALRIAETLAGTDAELLRAYAQECDAEARRAAAGSLSFGAVVTAPAPQAA